MWLATNTRWFQEPHAPSWINPGPSKDFRGRLSGFDRSEPTCSGIRENSIRPLISRGLWYRCDNDATHHTQQALESLNHDPPHRYIHGNSQQQAIKECLSYLPQQLIWSSSEIPPIHSLPRGPGSDHRGTNASDERWRGQPALSAG